MNAHFFNIETLIKVNSRPWIVDKNNPSVPVMKLTKWDFNLIKSGIYKKQGNLLQFSGNDYYFPTEMWNEIKVVCKKQNIDITKLAISLREYMDGEIIKELDADINLDNIKHLRNTGDDIYIICSRNTKEVYSELITKLEEKLSDIGLKVKDYYYISDTFLSRDKDGIAYTKVKLILQHLMGRRSDKDKFTDEEIVNYEQCFIYDDDLLSIKLFKDANNVFKFIMDNTKEVSNSLYEELKSRVDEIDPKIVINEVTANKLNRFKTSNVTLTYDKIKTFESYSNTFILEKGDKPKKLLPLVWTNRMEEILSDIQDKSPIAKKLYSTIEDNVEYLYDISFLDLTDKPDFISFIQTNRVYRHYEKEIEGIEDESEVIRQLAFNGNIQWPYENQRNEVSVGKFARKIFGSEFTDREIEDFVNKWKRAFLIRKDPMNALEIVSGEDIRYWYDESNYYNSNGSLGDSCMRYDHCGNYFGIYVNNPETCGLLIYTKNDQLCGRALLWKTEGSSEFNFMDRIYYNNSRVEEMFISYANKHNMMYRSGRDGLYDTNETPLDLYKDKIRVKVTPREYSLYPYMDTLFFYDYNRGILTNMKIEDGLYIRYTEGDDYRDAGDMIFVKRDNCYFPEDDVIYIESIEDYVHTDDARYINSRDEWALNTSQLCRTYDGNNEFKTDCVYSDELDTYILKTDAIQLYNSYDDLDYFPDGSITIEIGDKEYYYDSVVIDPTTDEYVPKSKIGDVKEKYYGKYSVSDTLEMENVYHKLIIEWFKKNHKKEIDETKEVIIKYIDEMIPLDDDFLKVKHYLNTDERLNIAAISLISGVYLNNSFGSGCSWFSTWIKRKYEDIPTIKINDKEIQNIQNIFNF